MRNTGVYYTDETTILRSTQTGFAQGNVVAKVDVMWYVTFYGYT